MADPNMAAGPLESILCTEELLRRPARAPDYQQENQALVALAQALADSPQTILQRLAETILEALACGSAGVSLLTTHDGGKNFYWPAIAGAWKPHIGGGTPRDFGPCGTVLDYNTPLLFKHVERVYTYFAPVTPPVEEALLVPFYVANEAVGTIWAVAHDPGRRFDAEDKRQLMSLARFASAAYQIVLSLESSNRCTAIVESSDDAIVSKDLNGMIRTWNTGAERIFGYAPEDAIGRPVTLIIPPELHDEEREILERLRAGHRIDHYETIRLKKDGSRVNVSLTISPVRDAQGRVIGASKIARDITERQRVEKALTESALSVRLLQLQDEERRSIARELHDGVGQLLAAISMNASRVVSEKSKLTSDAARSVEENLNLIEQASKDIRTVSYLLHPPLLDEMGLHSALKWYIEGFAERSKIAAKLEFPINFERLPKGYELCLFRITQECLTNIHRHSGSSTALVRLSTTLEGIQLEVSDEGRGVDRESQAKIASGESVGVGLRGMRERLRQMGGSLQIHANQNGTGTTVTASLPRPEPAECADDNFRNHISSPIPRP